jgi:cell division protein FtsI/penicillin-binding protein 2
VKSTFQSRCVVLCSILVIGLSALSARLVQIQLVNRHRYAESSRKTYHRVEKLPALRGMIVDRREEPLAKSVPVSTVIVDKKILMDPKLASFGLAYQQVSSEHGWNELDPGKQRRRLNTVRGDILAANPPETIVRKHLAYAIGMLARPMGLRREELREKIENSKADWIPVAKELPEDIAENLRETVEKNWIQGFEFQGSIKRWYTSPDMASHLVGFISEREVKDENGMPQPKMLGVFGVEMAMESFLAGREGWREHLRDTRGLLVPGNSASLKPPRAGLNVKLTIDMGLQAIAEEELDAGLKEFESNKGAVIMMDPKTGEVLAMVSRPNFDLNTKVGLEQTSEANVNYALQTVYEPGSTIKIVATSGALNEGLVTPFTTVNCYNGYYQSGAVIIRDDHPAGSLTFEGVLQKSNNNGTCSLGRQLGSKRFYEYLNAYGFGKKTGIQLAGESAGLARNTNNEVDFSRACFGYAASVTPLQLACAYAVIAGDGNLRKPHIVRQLIANDGTVVEDYQPEVVNKVLKPETARKMRAALEKVVQKGGTATLAAVPGFNVAGKTGTVQKHKPKGERGYYENRYIVSFVGMMPAEDPEFVCIVVVDDPQTTKVTRYGGTIAAPVFGRIAKRAAEYLNLQPTEPIPPQPLAKAER